MHHLNGILGTKAMQEQFLAESKINHCYIYSGNLYTNCDHLSTKKHTRWLYNSLQPHPESMLRLSLWCGCEDFPYTSLHVPGKI